MEIDRVTDFEQLKRIAQAQKTQINHLMKVLAAQSQRIDALVGGDKELQQSLELLQAMQAKSEAAAKPRLKRRKKKAKGHSGGPRKQPELPQVERVFELDEADQICPSCGGELSAMDGQFEESEMIDVVEVRYELVQVKQQKYVCKCGSCVETAIGPERAKPGSRYSLLFALKAIIDKYVYHLPLARQERILKRHGAKVSRQTLWDLIGGVATELEPAYDALFSRLLERGVIGLDQTSWKRLDNKDAKPWQMWCLTSNDTVLHAIRDDKSAATFEELVGNYQGVIVCDALSTHGAGASKHEGITLAGCWAHVMRRFKESVDDHPEAEIGLNYIGKLYELDEEGKRAECVEVLDEMKQWLWTLAPLKTLSIGKAARYALNNWERLILFVDDPEIPLDNNQTERGIRGPVVGRKNHWGSKSRRGTEVASVLYTLIETAKLNGLNPAEYMLEAVRAARRGEVLMPLPA